MLFPFSARIVSAARPTPPPVDDNAHSNNNNNNTNWNTTAYQSHPLTQGHPAVGTLLASGIGVRVDVVSDQETPAMRRFGSLDYGHPVFPSAGRSYLGSPNVYPLPGRKDALYDDDFHPWDYPGYHVRVDSGLGDDVDPPHWEPEDRPRRAHRFSSRRGKRASMSPDSSKEGARAKNRGGNKFGWLFGRRRHSRRDSIGEHDVVQNEDDDGGDGVDVDAESLDSFAAYGEGRRSPMMSYSGNDATPETFDVLQEYLQQFKRERAKIRHERRQFQKLKTGLEDLLRSWGGPEGIVYESAPHSADGAYFAGPYSRSPQPDCPLSAATDPGPSFRTGERSPGLGFGRGGHVNADIDRYNEAWNEAKIRSASDGATMGRIPWPTKTLMVEDLSQNEGVPPHLRFQYLTPQLPSEISDDQFLLRKWNAFNFLVNGFGLRATYALDDQSGFHEGSEDGSSSLVFDIDSRGASKTQLEKLKSQLLEEKLRWHPDARRRLRLGSFSELEAESAKSVWCAILDASKACKRCLARTSRP